MAYVFVDAVRKPSDFFDQTDSFSSIEELSLTSSGAHMEMLAYYLSPLLFPESIWVTMSCFVCFWLSLLGFISATFN